ncbi:MAG: glycosyltransferase family 2 protein [Chryseobacterium sp.]|jgi:glycosyltransferase involved in cell wall biosynthesis|uniref:glycosyltransferase family 2 protein n=1 Tax=Chryseobacterium sp. TaxID=1871047 RepID=UPI00283086B9|nr:glycosyltransferase family A protein [Chryseobacterium sp.]MDR2234791.1 glycosyltransferase family 2 protein [Chryseobacterium sp.]
MKLSICIPVYNFDVRELVSDLKKEIGINRIDAEIILIDDASDNHFKTLSQHLSHGVDQLVFLEKNIGRSRIRNLFKQYATGDYFLFLDCDGKINTKDFLKNYTEFIKKTPQAEVIYGGRNAPPNASDPEHYLRWKFAVERENLPVELRRNKPYLSFQTNNFIIKKEIFEKIKFNPEFQKYGYEDLLFAMELKSAKVKIHHIDNAILNNDLESNRVYVEKVAESVESLAGMLKDEDLKPKLAEVKLVKWYIKLHSTPFSFVIRILLGEPALKMIKRQLLKGNVNLRYLDLYKLGLLFKIMN